MKCQKCGFVSFDYLSKCKKCGVDLTDVRELLGFSALKAEVPFLLGTLLKNGGKDGSLQGGASTEGVDIHETGSLGLHRPEVSGPERPNEKQAHTSEPEPGEGKTARKDELVIELSEDDLEALAGIDKK